MDKEMLQAIGDMLDAKLDVKLQPISDRLTSLEQGQVQMQGQIKQMDSRLGNLEQGQVQMQGQIKQMDSRLGNLEQGQVQMQGQIKQMDSRLGNLEQGVTSVRESQIRFELEELPRIAVALDGVSSGLNSNKELNSRVSILERIVERVDCDVFALKTRNM